MSEEFSPGVKIILERIRDFPDDFVDVRSGALYSSKSSWRNLVGEIMSDDETFTKEEKNAVRTALRTTRRAQFDARVLDLLAGKPETEDFNELYGQAIQNAVLTGTGVLQSPKKLIINRAQMEIAKKLAESQFDQEYAKAKPKMEGGPV